MSKHMLKWKGNRFVTWGHTCIRVILQLSWGVFVVWSCKVKPKGRAEPVKITCLFRYCRLSVEKCISDPSFVLSESAFVKNHLGESFKAGSWHSFHSRLEVDIQPRADMMISDFLHVVVCILIFWIFAVLNIYNMIVTYFFNQDDVKANLFLTVKCEANISSLILQNLPQ